MVHIPIFSPGRKVFAAANYLFFICVSLACLFPLVHILAVSFSTSADVSANEVTFWPVDFTWSSYRFAVNKPEFMNALGVSVERVLLGTAINMILTILAAYPLSKEEKTFKGRTLYAWAFVFTILFSGGLIPWYITIMKTGLLDKIWALILPGAVPVFNVVLLLNFFRGLPKELEEAAFMDGAGHWATMIKVFVPLATPALATVALFTIVGHWNSWFDGLILMNSPGHYPLQSYLQTVVIKRDLSLITSSDLKTLAEVSDRTLKCAQIFIASLPILIVYPLLQKYFVKGIVLGSVKE